MQSEEEIPLKIQRRRRRALIFYSISESESLSSSPFFADVDTLGFMGWSTFSGRIEESIFQEPWNFARVLLLVCRRSHGSSWRWGEVWIKIHQLHYLFDPKWVCLMRQAISSCDRHSILVEMECCVKVKPNYAVQRDEKKVRLIINRWCVRQDIRLLKIESRRVSRAGIGMIAEVNMKALSQIS